MDRPMAQARDHSRRVPPSRLGLELLVGGLITGLLVLAGGALIEASPGIDSGSSSTCIAFQVGSARFANTYIHLQNDGPERINVRLDFVDHDGRAAQTIGYNPILNPSESGEFVFRTPALGATVRLTSSGSSLLTNTEIRYDDDTPLEVRKPIACHAYSDALGLEAARATH
jgi:hypothetical protein